MAAISALTELARDTPGSIAGMMPLNDKQRALGKSLPTLEEHLAAERAKRSP